MVFSANCRAYSLPQLSVAILLLINALHWNILTDGLLCAFVTAT